MTYALFLGELDDPQVGDEVSLTGDEGHHAAVVRRVRQGETIMISDGVGSAVRGPVTAVGKSNVTVVVEDVMRTPECPLKYVVAQALAKGDRAELAVEVLTELGIDEVVPWAAARSIVKWVPERGERSLLRWRSTAREATKQSRRFRVPIVGLPMTTRELALRVQQTSLTLVLHEEAETPLSDIELPVSGEVLIIVGPEGGITDEELAQFSAAGAKLVSISDGVLRTSTAGLVALAQVQALAGVRA